MNLTYKRAHKYFSYNDKTGNLTWKAPLGRALPGEMVGYWTAHGYAVRINKKAYQVHRIIWLMLNGEWPKHKIRHLDGDKFNNRARNIAAVTTQAIHQKQRLATNNTSGVKGVSWNTKLEKWKVAIKVGGEDIYLGVFKKINEAEKVRKEAEIYYWGDRNC